MRITRYCAAWGCRPMSSTGSSHSPAPRGRGAPNSPASVAAGPSFVWAIPNACSQPSPKPAGKHLQRPSQHNREETMQETPIDWAASPARWRDQLGARLDAGIALSQAAFLAQQKPEGYWHAPLEANVSMGAEYIFFNRFMGRRPQAVEARIVEHILATPADDGRRAISPHPAKHTSN